MVSILLMTRISGDKGGQLMVRIPYIPSWNSRAARLVILSLIFSFSVLGSVLTSSSPHLRVVTCYDEKYRTAAHLNVNVAICCLATVKDIQGSCN